MLKSQMRLFVAVAAMSVLGSALGSSAKAEIDAGTLMSSGDVEYTLWGDANLDGTVNGADFSILANNFNQIVVDGWNAGDLNYDGVVNAADFNLLADSFNKQAADQTVVPLADVAALNAFAAANGLGGGNVPEPVSGSFLVVGAVGVLGGRRRKVPR